jgi:S-DNA-T family DNA segregation ATPase FtsK/SpoIIIE
LLSRSTPDELRLLVIDGPGTPFAALSGLPHLDHHPARSPAAAGLALTAAQRALDSRRMTAGSLPPLVFMIADIAALADVPGLADTLSDISRCGPALGVHLIAATSSAEAPLTAEAARGLFQTLFVGRTASKVDSRRWMAATGAEDLLPARDVLIATRSDALRRLSGGGELPRVHPVTLDGTALERVVAAVMTPKPAHAVAARVASPVLTTRHPQPTAPAFAAKPLRAGPIPATIYDRALPLVMQFAAIDADLLTQRLGIAYPQALDVLVQLQADRLVTAPDQNGECRVLVGRTA